MPPADSGKVYETVDARCDACVIKGGPEQPCMPPHYPEMDEAKTGFPCPRREWARIEHPVIFHLCQLGAHGERGHLFREMFDAYFGDEPREERQRVLRLIFRAYQDEVVAATFWPEPAK